MIPFRFTVPQHIPSPDVLNEQLLRLPPSLDASDRVTDTYGRPCMQPLIEYAVRSHVTVGVLGNPLNVEVQHSRKVVLIPFTEVAPPLEQADFPGEFRSSSTTVLRRRPSAVSIGDLTVAMDEPEPLRIVSQCGKNCGKAWIKLTFRPSGMKQVRARQERWECAIDSCVRVNTFNSTMPLREMASYRLLRANRHVRVHSELLSLNPRKAYLHLCAVTKDPSNQDLGSSQPDTYTTKLLLPIDVTENLLPTFCSPLAARRYALKVCFKMKGLSHQQLALEAPLQVYYCKDIKNRTQDLGCDSENTSGSPVAPITFRSTVLDEDGIDGVITSHERGPIEA